MNPFSLKLEPGTVEPEVLRCVQKLQETWNGKCELLEKIKLEVFEARGSDPTGNYLQVSADTFECEPAKVRKCDMRHVWHMYRLPLHIMVGEGKKKEDREHLQLGHGRKPLEQSIRREVGGWLV